jgi:ubiquinone/menaquinone biosynthesis C-methylase UbiE
VSGVNYDQRLYRVYRAGRALSEDTGRLWMDAIGRYLGGPRPGLTGLDLGAGTGRFATLLADVFAAQVLAVEPSEKMRAEAERHSLHPRVMYRDGAATAIPAADAAFDFAFLSMMIHHVPDVAACARELHRVVRPDGLVFVRNVFAGRLDGIPHYEFFPSARALDEARLPTVERVRDAFIEAGFVLTALDTLEQQIDPSLDAHYDRIKQRALSTLETIGDAEFEEGLSRMRRAADLETTPTPVLERIDLLVLQNRNKPANRRG